MSNHSRLPDFFKVYLPGSFERLPIPPAFVKYLQGALPKDAVLINQKGHMWPVMISLVDGSVCFLDGWQRFINGNLLEYGDFLVFAYDGRNKFYVKIFGRSALEKMEGGIYKKPFMDTVKLEEDEEVRLTGEIRVNSSGDRDSQDSYDDEDDEDYVQEHEESDSTEIEEVGKTNSEIIGSKKKAKVKVGGGSKGKKAIQIGEGNNELGDMKKAQKQIQKHHCGFKNRPIVRAGRTVFLSEKIDVSKYVQPRNPHFFATVRTGDKKDLLLVPALVLKQHKLELPADMIYENEHGRQWPGHTVYWGDGRTWISGWNSFCIWNKITQDDYCLCELLPGRDGLLGDTLKVWIIRNAGSYSRSS